MSKLKDFLEFCVEPEVPYSRDPLVFAQRVIEAIQEKASSLLKDEELFPVEDKDDTWVLEQEKAAEKLLARLRQQPLAKEREELGNMLMRHIDSFTPEERKRYDELQGILREG